MNMSWLSMVGGGITAAATLAIGISTSGILAADPTSEDLAPAAGETIYVEQPVVEVPATGAPIATSSIDPIVIAILPAPGVSGTSAATDPSVTPDPSMSAPPYEDGDEYLDYEDGEYEDEYEHEEEYEEEYEDEVEHEDDDGYDDGYEDEGSEEGEDD